MRKFLITMSLIAAATLPSFASTYFFSGIGAGTTDFAEVSNWNVITSESLPWKKWGISYNTETPLYTDTYEGTATYRYKPATSLPTAADNFAVVVYYLAEPQVSYQAKQSINMTASVSMNDFLIRSNGSSFYLGNSSTTDAFNLNVAGDMEITYSNRINFYRNTSAKNGAFNISVTGAFRNNGDTGKYVYFGEASRYLDTVKFGSVAGGSNLVFYAKKVEVAGGYTMSAGRKTSLFVSDSIKDGAVMTIGGKFSKNTADKFLIDFSHAGFADDTVGVFDILLAQSYEGFGEISDDFTVSGLDNLKNKWNLQWYGETLQLNIEAIPEPATFASILGIFALCIVFLRNRRK